MDKRFVSFFSLRLALGFGQGAAFPTGDIESGRGEDAGANADSGFGGASGHLALSTAKNWGEDVALVPDSLQHSVHFDAQFNQRGQGHRCSFAAIP